MVKKRVVRKTNSCPPKKSGETDLNSRYFIAGIIAVVVVVAIVGLVVMFKGPSTSISEQGALVGQAVQFGQLEDFDRFASSTQRELQFATCEESNEMIQKKIKSKLVEREACGKLKGTSPSTVLRAEAVSVSGGTLMVDQVQVASPQVESNAEVQAIGFELPLTGNAIAKNPSKAHKIKLDGMNTCIDEDGYNANFVGYHIGTGGGFNVLQKGTLERQKKRLYYPAEFEVENEFKQIDRCFEFGKEPIDYKYAIRDAFKSFPLKGSYKSVVVDWQCRGDKCGVFGCTEKPGWEAEDLSRAEVVIGGRDHFEVFLELSKQECNYEGSALAYNCKVDSDCAVFDDTLPYCSWVPGKPSTWKECSSKRYTQGTSTTTATTTESKETDFSCPAQEVCPECPLPDRAEWECKWKIDDEITYLQTQIKKCSKSSTSNERSTETAEVKGGLYPTAQGNTAQGRQVPKPGEPLPQFQ